ncbi:MAG: hypothetical protein IT430_13430 [Phycisphaerales bacterium]|nr:hypothetical protein [Phycisphaerales bacterium]
MASRTDILRHLEPVSAPAAIRRADAASRRRVGEADFRTLIATAQDDIRRTNRPVTVASGISLTTEQHGRLERAADAALAHDSRTALVLLDGQALLLDVQGREVHEDLRGQRESERIITDVDTVVVSRLAPDKDGRPVHDLMLGRLSGRLGAGAVSKLIQGDERDPSRRAHDTIGD